MKGLLRCGKRRWRAAGNLNIYPVRSQHAVTQGRQLAAAIAQPIKVELGADQALTLGLLGDQAAPGVDQQAVAPGAAAILMQSALRGSSHKSQILDRSGAQQNIPVGLSRTGGECAGHQQQVNPGCGGLAVGVGNTQALTKSRAPFSPLPAPAPPQGA